MDYPIIVFMDDKNTYRVLVPDFDDCSFICHNLDDAFLDAETIITEKIKTLKAAGQNIPLATEREQYITRYLDAVLVNKVSVHS